MRRGRVKGLAVVTSLSVVLALVPQGAAADGNSNLHLFKFVDPQQLTITPAIGAALTVDKASAIPGTTLTYTAVVTNPTASFGMGGYFNAQSTASADATIAYYWDELEYCGSGFDCGNGTSNVHWTPVATFENGQPGYVPVTPPTLHTGMTLAVQPVNRSGVTYPTTGDLVLGTVINPKATATWTYQARVVLTPAQLAVLADPSKATYTRNVLHLEITVRNLSAAQPATDPELFTNPFTTMGNPGAVRGVTVTFTLPDGSTTAVGPSQVVGFGVLSPGGSATAVTTYTVPVPAPRGAAETDHDYAARLGALNASTLTASAIASGTGFSGTVYATAPSVTTIENLPIVTITKTGPAGVNAGTTETNPLALTNIGGAAASALTLDDSVPSGAHGAVTGVPAALAAGASATASAAFPVPIDQPDGALTDTATVSWHDANANLYGPLTSSFATVVRNPLTGARLTLAPITAGPNTVGTAQQLTATLVDRDGNPLGGRTITLTVTGANPATLSATTAASGDATFSYVGANAGNDVAQATFTAGGLTLTSNTSSISWGRPIQTVTTGVVTGNFFANPNQSCTFDIGPTATPVFSQEFPDILFNAPTSAVPHDISNVGVNTRPFTDLTVDVNGNYNGTIVAQGGGQQAGTGALGAFHAELTGNLTVNQPGDLTFAILHDDGYIFGVGGAATRLNGDLEGNPPLNTPFNGYPVVAAWDTSSQGSSSSGTFTVHFPAAGTYPYELDYTDCGGSLFLVLEASKFLAQTDPLSVYVGYADGLRPGGSAFPFPWNGSPNVIFEGGGCCDNGAIRFDNSGTAPITFDSITVDVGPRHYDLWPPNTTLPPGQILIVTGTSGENFDTSDTTGGCNQSGFIPAVHVTIGGVTTTFNDATQILNTGGVDQATCQGGNESHGWTRIGGGGASINVPLPPGASLDISPFNVANAVVGQEQLLTVSAMDGSGNPVANVAVRLQVFGVNSQSLDATTPSTGLATFRYVGLSSGVDSVTASAFFGGLRVLSNTATVTWSGPGGTSGPPPPTITSPSPADGSVVTKPVAVDATIAPPSGASLTSWRVFYQAAAGGPQVVIGSGTGTPPSPLGVTFDPTLLADGVYTLTIEAKSDNGGVQDVGAGVTVYGGLKLGRYSTTFQDLSVPVSGYQMQVLRTYDSTDTSAGDFGVGWHVGLSNFRVSANRVLGAGGWTQYDKSCVLGLCLTGFANSAPRYVTVVFPDQHSEIFDFVPAGGTNIFWDCTPAFKARAAIGTTSTLVPVDDTSCSYTGDGNLYGSNGAYNPQRFQLTTRAGDVLILDTKLGLISMTDRNGNRLSVDATGVHSSNGQQILFTRDSAGRITRVTGPAAGQSILYTYSAGGDLSTSTDPLGNSDAYSYDGAHHLLKVSGPQGQVSAESYDSSGRLISVTDASGHTIQIQNDVGTQSQTYTDAVGLTTTVVTADDSGDVVREDVIAGGQTQTTSYVYDSAGHVTQKTDALGHIVKAEYDASGDMTRVTDADGHSTQFAYDANGQITSIIRPDGGVLASATYDANGNLVTTQEANGAVLHTTYDSAGRPTSRTDAAGNVTSYSYDSTGNLSTLIDATGNGVQFSYDAGNRPVLVTDALGNKVRLTYDAAGNMTGVVDANGNAEAFSYAADGKLTSATDPLGATATATYDPDGRVTAVKDRSGNTTTYTRDADGRLTRVDYPGGEFLAFTYDAFGRPISVANSAARLDNTYDAVGELVSTTTTAPAVGTATISYTYDAAGNRLSAAGADGKVSYAYDSDGRLTTITDPTGGSFAIQYDSASRISGLTRPNGISDSYAYDSDGRLVGIASTSGGSAVQSLTRTFDANGQVASTTDAAGTTTYTHDANGRLTAVNGPGSTSQTYAYDAAGNRTSGPLSPSNAYNAADEMTSDSNFTYTYDGDGRRTSKVDRATGATTSYSYNEAGQITSIRFPDGTSTNYTYDPLGRRIGVTSGGTTTGYVYDGANLREEYDSGALAASFVGTDAVDRPLEMTRGGSSYFYLDNFQGSVTSLTNAGGAIAASYSYDAFGNPTSAAPALSNPLTYTGREYDPKSGLYYNRDRYYDPATGSFVSQDPVRTGQPYAYSAGDPIDFTDPNGAGPMAELGQIWTTIDTKFIQPLKTVACGLAAAGGLVEIMLNAVTDVGVTAESVTAILVGVSAACIFASFNKAPTSVWSLLLFPLIAVVVAVVADLLLEIECVIRKGGSISPQHIFWTGVAAAVIGLGGAVLGAPIAEGSGVAGFAALAGVALLGSGMAGWADYLNQGGPC